MRGEELNMKNLKAILKDKSGATAVEYGLIAAGLVLAIIPALGDMNSGVLSIYGRVVDLLPQVM
jgi:Flp pilus assembly pilin Flp